MVGRAAEFPAMALLRFVWARRGTAGCGGRCLCWRRHYSAAEFCFVGAHERGVITGVGFQLSVGTFGAIVLVKGRCVIWFNDAALGVDLV